MLTANDILADVDFDHSIDWPGTALEQTSRSMTSRLPQDGYTHVADAVALEITAASELLVARVGGFRIHLLRAGRVSLIGSDHNLLSDPSASAEAVRRHFRADNPGSSLLARIVSRHLGTPHVPETAAIPVEAHDSLVVCSQTVHHWREPESYAVALRQHGSAALATDGIVAVIELGGHSL